MNFSPFGLRDLASKQDIPLPFLLKAVCVFLAADGLFKLASITSGLMPGPEIFGRHVSLYYYILVAVVDISLSLQIVSRAHYVWVWGLAFFSLQTGVLFTSLAVTAPLSWVGSGILGRIQIALTIALYLFLARYFVTRHIREILSPQKGKSE